MAPFNARVRAMLREQMTITSQPEDARDSIRWFELQDELDTITAEELDPAWIVWGVQSVEGLVVEGKTLEVKDWADWPSDIFSEALDSVKAEAQMSSGERKNSESPTTSGEQVDGNPKLSIATNAASMDSGEIETAGFTILPN
jgi:hypothetical protein